MINSTSTTVTSSATTVRLLAANPNRKGAIIYNQANKVLSLAFGGTATVALSKKDIPALTSLIGGYYEVPFGYTGEISGIWEANPTGTANIVEFA
jgi:hypothetical protein